MPGTEGALERARARLDTIVNGKWRLRSILGIGGMATVYAAVHRNKKRAALKMLHPELGLNSSIRERFLREGYVANSIDHPGVVRIDDDDISEDGAAYLVMELLEGETLEARAERLGGTMPASEVFALVDQLLDVLAAAHAAGVVHRDLKPENLFLTTKGALKVLDFGIARLLEAPSSGRTSVGSFMGTPAFMSPEQARGRWDQVDARSDIWAVGATLYTLLTGMQVYDADTVNEQLILAATTDAPSLALRRPDLPFDVIALVDRALARDQTDRWQNVTEMHDALELAVPLSTLDLPRAPSGAPGAQSDTTTPVRISIPSDKSVSSNEPTLLSERTQAAAGQTGVPVTQSMPADRWAGKQRSLLIGGVFALLALASVVFVASMNRTPPPARQTASAKAEPVAAPAAPPPAKLETPAIPVDSAAALAAPSAVASQVAAAVPSPAAAPQPNLVRSGAARGASARVQSPAPTATATAAPASHGDPFDRRF